jgi:hypothetical protein
MKKFRDKKKENKFVLPHDGFIKSIWNIWILFFIMYTAVYQPYKIAFVEDDALWEIVVDTIMDITFLTDIVLNFFTDYLDAETNQRITSMGKIAKAYLKTTFAFDLVAGFPF